MTTPAEALAWNTYRESMDELPGVPIYESDGVTQIGTFPISPIHDIVEDGESG